MNRITFTIDTEAPYSDEEKDALLNNLVDFFKGEDPDVIDGTEELSIIDADDASNDVMKAHEIALGFLKEAKFTFNVQIDMDDVEFERGAVSNG